MQTEPVENNTAPLPPIMEQSPQPDPAFVPQGIPAIPVQPRKKMNMLPFVVFVIILVVLFAVSRTVITVSTGGGSAAQTSSTPTPTGTVSVSTRSLAPYATESAFVQFEQSVDGLPKTIQGAVLQDATVLPPVLDLPLGF